MKPPRFSYLAPDTVEEVLDILAEHGDDAVVLAGGQSLVPLLNLRLAQPAMVVDPRRCAELRHSSAADGTLTARAMVTAGEIERSSSAGSVPGLREAISNVGHVQIRNRSTLGGMLAHADPAAEVPALLLATGGTVTLQSRDRGTRTVAAEDFLLGPFTTAREPDELLTEINVARPVDAVAVREIGPRPGDFATVGAVVGVSMSAGSVVDARVVVFGAGSRAQRIGPAEEALRAGGDADEAAAAVRREVDALDDAHASAEYRRHAAGTLVRRALGDLTGTPGAGRHP